MAGAPGIVCACARMNAREETGCWVPGEEAGGVVAWRLRCRQQRRVLTMSGTLVHLVAGRGVARDESHAAELLQSAAEAGDVDAMVAIARCYREGGCWGGCVGGCMQWVGAG